MQPYQVRSIAPQIWSIEEDGVRSLLYEGENKAMLVDTGYGTGNLAALVAELTQKPILLVNTHVDRDHTGCNASFGRVHMHPSEFALYRERTGSTDVAPLWEGDVIDLGGMRFEVFLIPGHTPGSIALLDEKRRTLFCGDSVQPGPVYMFGAARNLPAYIAGLERLARMKSLTDRFDVFYASHGELEVEKSLLPAVIETAKRLLRGELPPQDPGEHMAGSGCKLYDGGAVKFFY